MTTDLFSCACVGVTVLLITPLFVPLYPQKFDVNAASLKDIGDFDTNKLRGVKLNERFKKTVKLFDHTSVKSLQEEMVAVLEKAENRNKPEPQKTITEEPVAVGPPSGTACCTIA